MSAIAAICGEIIRLGDSFKAMEASLEEDEEKEAAYSEELIHLSTKILAEEASTAEEFLAQALRMIVPRVGVEAEWFERAENFLRQNLLPQAQG